MRIWLEKSSHAAEFILVAVIFFGLGAFAAEHFSKNGSRMAVMEPEAGFALASPIIVTDTVSSQQEPSSTPVRDGSFVASRNGKTYYRLDCKNNIKEENKIYFKTEEDAQKAGLTPAKNCFK